MELNAEEDDEGEEYQDTKGKNRVSMIYLPCLTTGTRGSARYGDLFSSSEVNRQLVIVFLLRFTKLSCMSSFRHTPELETRRTRGYAVVVHFVASIHLRQFTPLELPTLHT